MLIKKTFQGSIPENKIINTYSDSQTDTYSCDYTNSQKPQTIFTGALKGGQSVTLSNAKRFLKVYVSIDFAAGDGCFEYVIDTTKDNPSYGGGILPPFDEQYYTSLYSSEASYNNGTFTHVRIGYYILNTNEFASRNDNSSYIIYRIDTYDMETNSSNSSGTINVVNQYSASTTDSYSCNYVNNLETYSTTEKRIGTWIDDKPIYRRVFSFLLNGTYTESGKTFTWYSTDIPFDAISRCSGYVVINGTKYLVDGINDDLNVVVDNYNRIQVGVLSSLQNNQTIYVILEYTKTTD